MGEQEQQQSEQQPGIQQTSSSGRDLKGMMKKLQDRAREAVESQQAANREELEDLSRVRKRIEDQNEQNRRDFNQEATSLKSDAVTEFRDTRDLIRERMARMKAEIGERKEARDVRAAERRAELAEDYAAEVISWVSDGLGEAEIAVIEAAAARADAKKLKQGGGATAVH